MEYFIVVFNYFYSQFKAEEWCAQISMTHSIMYKEIWFVTKQIKLKFMSDNDLEV